MKRLRVIGALACAAGVLGLLPALAPASVQVGSSGWQWGNPLPQGNTLHAMSFAGASGYAAGDFGTLLHTADGGTTWSGLLSGTFTDLTEVQAIDADSLFAAGGCVARRSDDGGRTFTRVAFTPVESSCKEQFAAGWFVNQQTGFLALTDGTVLRTDNDGDTFGQKNALPGTRAAGGGATPVDLRFLSDQIGLGATSDGKIYRTHRRRQLVEPHQRHEPRRALVLLRRRQQRLRRGRRLAVPDHQGRRGVVDGEGPRHPADQPALDPLRDAAALRHDDRQRPRDRARPTTAARRRS